MYTVAENSIYQYEIKKSKFIALLYPISKIEDTNFYLQETKRTYKDATHYCYAYKLDMIQKFSDDGEPGGTAGLPIMEILNKNELNNILCIVVRYFGGIKLGSGGLIRAYSNVTREVIHTSHFIKLVPGFVVSLTLAYQNQKTFDYLFSSYILEKSFSEQVVYSLLIPKEKIHLLQPYSYQIIEEKLIAK